MPIITNTGIQAITQDEYLEKIKSGYKDINKDWVLDSNSPDGQLIIVLSNFAVNPRPIGRGYKA
ncbi:hypothetical protein [Vibrio harveyi]|uniref:hypothetical protein n=1 Tax=Vibrio harveyi TaxID=669 RepID=UPI003CFA89F8